MVDVEMNSDIIDVDFVREELPRNIIPPIRIRD